MTTIQELLRKDWMFKLVGSEFVEIGPDPKAKVEIIINAGNGFTYEYSILVNGKALQKFKQLQNKIMKTWLYDPESEEPVRVVLEKGTLDIWVNGQKIESRNEFADEGTEFHFLLKDDKEGIIKTASSGNKKEGIVYNLIVDGQIIPECKE